MAKSFIKAIINGFLSLFGLQVIAKQDTKPKYPIDYPEYVPAVIETVRPYTMCGDDGLMIAMEAAQYVVKNGIEGDIVECGVWRGGCTMAMALAMKHLNSFDRNLWMYDTFEGMTLPTDEDIDKYNQSASSRLGQEAKTTLPYSRGLNVWCLATLDDVKSNISTIAYPIEKFQLVKGDVAITLSEVTPNRISVLRLDTDWYASTKLELELLYPKLVSGGVLIIDDYGDWQGARKAADEYFSSLKNAPLLVRVDGSRVAIKP